MPTIAHIVHFFIDKQLYCYLQYLVIANFNLNKSTRSFVPIPYISNFQLTYIYCIFVRKRFVLWKLN